VRLRVPAEFWTGFPRVVDSFAFAGTENWEGVDGFEDPLAIVGKPAEERFVLSVGCSSLCCTFQTCRDGRGTRRGEGAVPGLPDLHLPPPPPEKMERTRRLIGVFCLSKL
jgi:hypothetical protein